MITSFAALVPEQQLGVILLALVAVYGGFWLAAIVRQALRKRRHEGSDARRRQELAACVDLRAYREAHR